MSAADTVAETPIQDSSATFTGRCKWFNNRRGYGFITVDRQSDDTTTPEDIFVHQTNIRPSSSSYRTLTQGEYVSFVLRWDGDTCQAVNVTGLNGGPLLCDSRSSRPGGTGGGGRGRGQGRGRRQQVRRVVYGNQEQRPEGEWVWRPSRPVESNVTSS
tara:strand:+ start:6100 stop:6573 length:474 start_codon:yes stop_codon:yes gene_type:complete